MQENTYDKIFEKMYVDFRKQLYVYVRKRINNEDLAQDITADVFLKLYQNKDVLKRESSGIKAWLYTVARNLIIDEYRKKSTNTERDGLDEDVFDLVTSSDPDMLGKQIEDESYQLILACMEGLSDIEKEIITLRYNDELRYKEISDIVNKDEGTVKMITYRALEKVRERIKAHDNLAK